MKNVKKLAAILLTLVMVVSVFSACDIKITPAQKLIGSWRDSTGTMGFEFFENGICKVTLLDINILGFPVNGALDGTYTVTKGEDDLNHLTVVCSIRSINFTREYTFDVDKSSLRLTDVSNGESYVLMAYTGTATQSTSAQ